MRRVTLKEKREAAIRALGKFLETKFLFPIKASHNATRLLATLEEARIKPDRSLWAQCYSNNDKRWIIDFAKSMHLDLHKDISAQINAVENRVGRAHAIKLFADFMKTEAFEDRESVDRAADHVLRLLAARKFNTNTSFREQIVDAQELDQLQALSIDLDQSLISQIRGAQTRARQQQADQKTAAIRAAKRLDAVKSLISLMRPWNERSSYDQQSINSVAVSISRQFEAGAIDIHRPLGEQIKDSQERGQIKSLGIDLDQSPAAQIAAAERPANCANAIKRLANLRTTRNVESISSIAVSISDQFRAGGIDVEVPLNEQIEHRQERDWIASLGINLYEPPAALLETAKLFAYRSSAGEILLQIEKPDAHLSDRGILPDMLKIARQRFEAGGVELASAGQLPDDPEDRLRATARSRLPEPTGLA